MIETGGDIPANIVEGDVNMLETEIVEGDHANKDNGERHHLGGKRVSSTTVSFSFYVLITPY